MLVACSQSEYQWKIVFDELPEVSFRGIAAVSDSVCWVSGSRGTILRTTDGGESWENRSIPGTDSLDFRDIEVFGPDTAVVMSIGSGTDSRLYRTVDGGTNWSLVHQNKYEQGFYDAITFWDNGHGLLQGDPIDGRLFILVTTDGGRVWQEVPKVQMPEVADGEYAFAASGSHLISGFERRAWIGTGGKRARVLKTSDYGNTWRAIPTPFIQGAASTGIFSLAFADSSYGIAVGGDYQKENEGTDNIIFTEDGGESWKPLSDADLDFRSSIWHTNGIFITVGPTGSEYSVDGGTSWISIKGPGFHALSVGAEGREAVWAAGSKGRIGRLVRD